MVTRKGIPRLKQPEYQLSFPCPIIINIPTISEPQTKTYVLN